MNGSNRNLIIIIAGIIGVCICGACAVAGVVVLLPIITAANGATGAIATLQAEMTLSPLSTPIGFPTIGSLPTIPSIPTVAFTPPINIQRGTPTPPTISRATPTSSGVRTTPAPGGSTRVVFTDEFKSPCNLVDDDNDKRTFKCENGSYTMLNKTGTSRWVYYSDDYDDLVMEVDAHAVSGPAFIEYGIIFRVSSDGTDFYGFTLTRDGKYTLWRCQDPCQDSSDFVDIISYTAAPTVKTGTATNHIKVVAQGDQIAFYVNDQWLNTVTDDTLSGGTVGLFLNNKDPNAKAAFEHLKISEINGQFNFPKGVPTKQP